MLSKGKELTPYDVSTIKNNMTGMEYLRLFGGIPAPECDERIRTEETLARKEAQNLVDQEHKDDAGPSSIASCRSIEGADAAEGENDRKMKEAEGGCYDLRDGDGLEAKASAIVSNVISRARSVVEREKSEDTLRTDTTFRSVIASTVSECIYGTVA